MNELYEVRKRPLYVPLIILINILIYILWSITEDHSQEIVFMNQNFLVSWTHLTSGHYWVLFTSVFSHNMLWHLFLNMYVLLSFGSFMERVLGRRRFIRFYIIAGLVSSFAHAATSYFLLNSPDLPALGASGAIAGIVVLFSLLFPKEKILIFGLIPIPALIGAILFIGLDLWGLIAQLGHHGLPIGHGAHLGGAFTGIIYFFIIRSRSQRHSQ